MLHIDVRADLHMEDDAGHNVARLSGAADPSRITAGAVFVAGSPDAWSCAQVVHVEGDWVHFRQLTTLQASKLARLVG